MPDVDVLTNLASQQRSDLRALTYDHHAAEKFRRAQHEQLFPTISALGVVGGTPYRLTALMVAFQIISFPAGSGLSAPTSTSQSLMVFCSQPRLRKQTSGRKLRQKLLAICGTRLYVTCARLGYRPRHRFQRAGIAAELSKEADLSLSLAQSRYQLGLGSIVEFSQAQLQQADAAIGYVNAQYQYRLSLSILNFEIGVQP